MPVVLQADGRVPVPGRHGLLQAPVFVSISSTLPVGIEPTKTLPPFPAAMPSGL